MARLTVEDFKIPFFPTDVKRRILGGEKRREQIEITKEILKDSDPDNPFLDEMAEDLAEDDPEFEDDRREAIEGTTFTDNFVKIGFTYFPDDGSLTIVNEQNQELFNGKIDSRDDFEDAVKKADKKHTRLRHQKD